MELTNDFRVSVAPPEAWSVLTDVERIAPMLPGAQLQEVEGEDYRGIVKVKVGPITAQYKGTATFVEKDQEAGKVVLRASGRDTRGQGNANATITATMSPDGEGTRVKVVTDLTVTGKVAQFGRGVLADVSSKLIGQFVDALEADLEAGAKTGSDSAVVSGPGDAGEVAAGEVAAKPAPKRKSAIKRQAPEATPVGVATAPEGLAPMTNGAPDGESTSTSSGSKPLVGDAVGGAASPADQPSAADPSAADPSAADPSAADHSPTSTSPTSTSPTSTSPTSTPGIRKIDSPEPAPVDLLDAVGGSVAKRVIPMLLAVLAVVALISWKRHRGAS